MIKRRDSSNNKDDGLFKMSYKNKMICWQARRGSNPQPTVLETAILPIELLTYFRQIFDTTINHSFRSGKTIYSIIDATTPAPTVRPPSRIAKRNPSSIAIGEINFTFTEMLSPGITISTPSGNSTAPVTSVVLK